MRIFFTEREAAVQTRNDLNDKANLLKNPKYSYELLTMENSPNYKYEVRQNLVVQPEG